MKLSVGLLTVIAIAFIIFPGLYKPTVNAEQLQPKALYQKADLKNGALLYDNWLEITNAKPEGNHPLYPNEAQKNGKTTWRCKECHGWDYIGDQGRYRKGSHYTGIKGVYDARSQDHELLYSSLTNSDAKHDFSAYLSASQLRSLVKFLREGQADISLVLDNQGKATGNAVNGKVLFDAQCSSCHGSDGNDLDFNNNKEGIQGVGWLANENPQESIHKIRWGHPGSNMPSMIVDSKLSEQDAIDILTFSQELGSR